VIGGVVLDTSAVLDIATGATIYGQAFVSTAMARGVVHLIPGSCLGRAWTVLPDADLPVLERLLDMPVVVVDDLTAATAPRTRSRTESGRRDPRRPASLAPGRGPRRPCGPARGWRVLTRALEQLWRIDPALAIETPPPE
jgi:hypothetical protein